MNGISTYAWHTSRPANKKVLALISKLNLYIQSMCEGRLNVLEMSLCITSTEVTSHKGQGLYKGIQELGESALEGTDVLLLLPH